MRKYLYILLISVVPQISEAATSVQGLLTESSEFISGTLIVFLFGLAFLFIVVNVFRYFILGGADQEGQKKAKALAVYGVAAFVFLTTFYGIVNLLTESTGLAGESAPPSDFFGLGDWNGDDGSGGGDDDQNSNIVTESLNLEGNETVGQSVVFKGMVRNSGTISISGFSSTFSYCWTTTVGCNFINLSGHNVDSLDSGLSQTQVSDSLSLTQAGILKVRYCVDSGNAILESNEDDNCTEMEYEIEGEDTVPTDDKNLTASWMILNSGELVDGETVTFKGRVTNIGSDITDASNLKSSFKWCLVSGEVCNYSLLTDKNTSIPFSAFASQEDISASLVLNQPGKIRIQYCVDSGNVITENNEEDNCEEKLLT